MLYRNGLGTGLWTRRQALCLIILLTYYFTTKSVYDFLFFFSFLAVLWGLGHKNTWLHLEKDGLG